VGEEFVKVKPSITPMKRGEQKVQVRKKGKRERGGRQGGTTLRQEYFMLQKKKRVPAGAGGRKESLAK